MFVLLHLMTSTGVLYSSCLGSVVTTLTCTPFDVVKNFWQGSPSLNHKRAKVGTLEIVSRINKQFGLRGFWRGTTVSLSYVVPNNLVYFSIYEKGKQQYQYPALAAAQARTVAVLCFSPIEFLRTKVQACLGQRDSATASQVIKRVLKEETFISLWRGAAATLLRDVPFSVLYFSMYELNKGWLLPAHVKLRRFAEDSSKLGILKNEEKIINFYKVFGLTLLNAAACASVATIATQPFDLVKTQLQSYERVKSVNNQRVTTVYTTSRAFHAVFSEYGWRGLFNIGLTPRIAKVVPASAIMLSVYEVVNAVFATNAVSID